MKKSIFKIITITAICILLAVSAFIATDILKSRQMIMEQANDSLGYMSENCANEFRAIFDNADLIVSNMTDIALETSEPSQLKNVAHDMAKNSKYPISLYYILDPNEYNYDIWYVKGMDGKVTDLSLFGADMEEWLQEYNEEKAEYIEFYNEAVKEGDMWYETMYDPDIKWEIVSRIKVIKDDAGQVMGIAAADVYLGDISEKLVAINNKTGGISSVTNIDGDLIAGDIAAVEKAKSSKYLSAISVIDNRWIITVVQPVSIATKALQATIFITLFLGVAVLAAFAVIIVMVYRKHGRSIIREFEEKDVLIINQSRQAQLGEMVGNIAHQLKQPLNGVNMALSNLQEDYGRLIDEDDRSDFADRIGRMKKRISGMCGTVDDFMEFLRPQKEKGLFSVKEEIINMVELMKESIHMDMIETIVSGEDFSLEGQKNEFGQCIFNMIDNARDAMKDVKEKEIAINLTTSKDDEGELYGYITISNKGSHIKEEDMDKVFDLYFTTKEKDGGTGIGLYLTKSIIEKHFNGRIRCFNRENGVSFEISVPLETKEAPLNEKGIKNGKAC